MRNVHILAAWRRTYPSPAMATAPKDTDRQQLAAAEEDLHRYIAPVVGPDDERVITDSGIEIKPLYDEDDVAPDLEERLGEPGSYPFTRGIHERMYRDRLWTMRQYAGFASPEDTNERYRYLTEHGSTGLSMAFDLPTQLGRDSDDPLCAGRGRPHRRPDRHARGHADLLRPDLARRRLDLDDDQRAGRDPAAALRARRRGAGRPGLRSCAGRSRTTC